jgi:hypothetical protein
MARNKKGSPQADITDYRHGEKRKNIPPAGLAAQSLCRDS